LASDPDNVETLLTVQPRYKDRKSPKRKFTQEIAEYINKCYRDNLVKISTGQRKQTKMAKDIYRELIEQGQDISYKTVCNYFHNLKAKGISPSDCFIKLGYVPGEKMEFDWGEVKIYIKGELKVFNMGTVSLCCNARFAKLSTKQDTQAMIQMHADSFHFFGKAPHVMVYDNMRTAVKSFVGEKTPTEAIVRLEAFYGFIHRFCNVCSGNEKPHVERSVEVMRRWAFAGREHFESLEEANGYLCEKCIITNRNVAEAMEEELRNMIPAPYDMSCFEVETRKVDRLATFCLDSNHYSVPFTYIGKEVWVKVFTDKLVVYDQEGICTNIIATHERCYDKNRWRMIIDHFLEVLVVKPRAIRDSVALKQAPKELKDLYYKYFEDDSKEFANMLVWAKSNGYTYLELSSAALICSQKGVSDISFGAIREILSKSLTAPAVTDVSSKSIEDAAAENLMAISCMFHSGVQNEGRVS